MKTLKTILNILLLSAAASAVFAGGQQEASSSAGAGPEKSEAGTQLRVISLGPNITETIYALGKGSLLVGRTDYCNYPPEVLDVQSVGPIQQPNVETIISLKPDVVIASTHGSKAAAELLAGAGIEVKYFYTPASFDGIYEVIRHTASELDAEAEAEALTASIAERYNALTSHVNSGTCPSVYYVVGFGEGGDWTAGGDTFIGAMINEAGGRNIAADVSGWSYSLEKLVESDPDVIIIGRERKDSFIRTPVYSELSAVKNSRVYGVDEDILSRQGPRLIEGLEILNTIFSEIDE